MLLRKKFTPLLPPTLTTSMMMLQKKTVESGLDRLIISIDGTTQDVYENYRVGGQLSKVIEGTKNIVKWKKELQSKTPHIIFQFLVVKPNEHQVEDVKKLGKELGVDEVRFKTAQVYDYENGNDLIPENMKYSRYKKKCRWKVEHQKQIAQSLLEALALVCGDLGWLGGALLF